MSLTERYQRLEPRERRLVGILGGVLGFMAFLAIPIHAISICLRWMNVSTLMVNLDN